MVLQESCTQLEFAILYLVGGFSSAEELKDIVMYIPWRKEEPGPFLKAELLFLDFPSLVSASPSFPDYQLFEPALWNSGKFKEAE